MSRYFTTPAVTVSAPLVDHLGLENGKLYPRKEVITALKQWLDKRGATYGRPSMRISVDAETREILRVPEGEDIYLARYSDILRRHCSDWDAVEGEGEGEDTEEVDGSEKEVGARLFLEKVLPRDKLAAFIGVPPGSTTSRQDITKSICAHCRVNGLMNGHRINPDATLTDLLGLTPSDDVSILNLQHYLEPLYTVE
jgi:hypothetical protein